MKQKSCRGTGDRKPYLSHGGERSITELLHLTLSPLERVWIWSSPIVNSIESTNNLSSNKSHLDSAASYYFITHTRRGLLDNSKTTYNTPIEPASHLNIARLRLHELQRIIKRKGSWTRIVIRKQSTSSREDLMLGFSRVNGLLFRKLLHWLHGRCWTVQPCMNPKRKRGPGSCWSITSIIRVRETNHRPLILREWSIITSCSWIKHRTLGMEANSGSCSHRPSCSISCARVQRFS